MKKLVAAVGVVSFGFAASSQGALLLSDSFSYPDGPIPSPWAIHSGTNSGTTALNIASGKAVINQGDTHGSGADANSALSSSFDPSTDNTSVIYAGFTVNFSALPVNGDSDGSYFAHLKSSAANEFYARIGANTNGAAAGKLRLTIADEVWNVAGTIEHPTDLDLNTTYQVVMKFDLSTDRATLWVNPATEASTSVTATDAPSYAAGTINAFALRQGTSGTGAPGILTVDDLKVATTFAEVVPEPATLCGLAGLSTLVLRRKSMKA
ncbi:MAG: hypothetical protein QM770_06500 [Tepidisphaeraceae bacterium]